MNSFNFAAISGIVPLLERHKQGIRLAMLGLVGCAIGAWFSNALARKLWQNMPPAPAPMVETETAPIFVPPPIEKFAAIAERNLFGVDIDRAVADVSDPATQTVVEAPVEKIDVSPLPAEVIGTLGGDDSVAVALIRDKRNKQVDVYWVGDKLFEQATIVEIKRGEVLVLRNGKTEILQLYEDGAGSGAASFGQMPPSAADVQATATPAVVDDAIVKAAQSEDGTVQLSVTELRENEYVIDKQSFEQAMSNLGPLLTQARVVPNFSKGKIEGYKIFAIKSGSVFEQIGIKNGDVIHNVNGVGVDTPEKALQLFQQLKSETAFKIDIERGGSVTPFNYQLR